MVLVKNKVRVKISKTVDPGFMFILRIRFSKYMFRLIGETGPDVEMGPEGQVSRT